jgi:GNAT superfamily N-acetyltransferase
VSWDDVVGGVSALRSSNSESLRFGLSVARLGVGAGWNSDFESEDRLGAHVREIIAGASEDIVIVRAPSNLTRFASLVASPGRQLVPAGTLLYWDKPVAEHEARPLPSGLTAEPLGTDATSRQAALEALTDSFDGYSNHYSHNPLLDPTVIADGYREWAESTLASSEGRAYVLHRDGRTIGVATTNRSAAHPRFAEIELAGIVSDEQKQGSYRYLLDAVFAGARASGCDTVVISTQSYNTRVQRAWAAAGFRPAGSIDTFHLTKAPNA